MNKSQFKKRAWYEYAMIGIGIFGILEYVLIIFIGIYRLLGWGG